MLFPANSTRLFNRSLFFAFKTQVKKTSCLIVNWILTWQQIYRTKMDPNVTRCIILACFSILFIILSLVIPALYYFHFRPSLRRKQEANQTIQNETSSRPQGQWQGKNHCCSEFLIKQYLYALYNFTLLYLFILFVSFVVFFITMRIRKWNFQAY